MVAALADVSSLLTFVATPEALDSTFHHALAALKAVVPFDLAALYEIHDDILVLQAAEGRLAANVRGHALPLARFPSIQRALLARHPVVLEQHDHESDEGDPYDGVLDLPPGHSCMVIPLYGEQPLGIITLDAVACGHYTTDTVALCAVYAQLVSLAIMYARRSRDLDAARARAEEQNRALIAESGNSVELACRRLEASESPAMKAVIGLARQVAVTDSAVVIHGETGTGKDLLAQAIHAWSARRRGPIVKLNCGSIPESLVESELFGHVKGAFTGAVKARLGRFVAATGGTLFLDEIGDMPLSAQTKLLRTLQEKMVQPVGSDETIPIDVRVIVASHVDLEQAVHDGRFREDLYYRLAVFPIEVPALRERPEDILPLALDHLLELSIRERRGPWILTEEAKHALQRQTWPGNVRQLVNAIERATIVKPAGAIGEADLGLDRAPRGSTERQVAPGALASVKDEEKRVIVRALERSSGKVYGVGGAAALLGIPPTTLQSKMKKLGLG